MKSIYATLFCVFAGAFLAGCDLARPAEDINDTPEMKGAVQAEREGDYDKAIERYKDAISLYPKAALPYLQLAILLDQRKDYLGAVYNYRRYLEVSARNNETGESKKVAEHLVKAKQCLAAEYVSMVPATGADTTVRLMQNMEQLNKRIGVLEQEKSDLVSSNEALRVAVGRLNAEIASKNNIIMRLKNNSSSSTGDQTYEVKRGDSLSKIAEDVYGDRTKWTRIRDANPDKVDGDRVKPGDVLVIPSF